MGAERNATFAGMAGFAALQLEHPDRAARLLEVSMVLRNSIGRQPRS